MYFSGITDEAGEDIEVQIAVAQTLGWSNIELRKVSVAGRPAAMIHDLPEEDFEMVASKLREARMGVSCFSSAVANWGKSVEEPMDSSLAEAERCIPRMKALGTKFVRIMSFAQLKDAEGHLLPPAQQMVQERIRRLKILCELFSGEGLQAVHENCMNYGGMGWPMTQELLAAIPEMKLVFDTGNPVFDLDFTKPEPRPMQDALEFYQKVSDAVVYVHVKDGVWDAEAKTTKFCFPGEGQGRVKEIFAELKMRGYDGGISIEPHMGTVFHDANAAKADADALFTGFVEYGRRTEALWNA